MAVSGDKNSIKSGVARTHNKSIAASGAGH